MRYLFSAEGNRALQACLAARPLLAFDFDGTLAPIVPVPDQARTPLSIAAAMQRLCAVAPVAVITGRAVEDVRERLGFEPHYIVGNHGAEGVPGSDLSHLAEVVDGWRRQVDDFGPLPEGVMVEAKRYSMAMHYRLARDYIAARTALGTLMHSLSPLPEIIGGKFVFNVLPPGSPDKHAALAALLAHEGRTRAVFVGDDETDESVFRQAPPSWITVRVGHSGQSAARYYISANAIAMLAQTLERNW